MKGKTLVITLLLTFTFNILSAPDKGDSETEPVIYETVKSGLVLKCFWLETKNFIVFDLKKLENSNITPFQFVSKNKTVVYYNFCENVKQKTCNGSNYQILTHTSDKDCKPLSGSFKNKNTWELIDSNDINKGVQITLNSITDQKCNDKGENYVVTYEIQCDKEALNPIILNGDEFDIKKCQNTLKFKTIHACPDTNILSIIKFFESKKEIFASIIIIGGLYLLILGTKLIGPTTYLISVVCIASIVFIVLIQFTIPSNAVDIVIWVVLGISVIAGGVIGFVITKYKQQVLGLLLGGYSGYLVGTLLYTSVTCRFFPDYALLVNIMTDVLMIIIFMLIAYFFFKYIVMLCTSLIGSYGIVRGIGTLVGNFPSERVIISLLQNGEKEQWNSILTPWVYGYLGGWILLFIGGVIGQYFLTKEENEVENFPTAHEKLVKSWE